MNEKYYIGRFAPSPTGPLHYGSLVAATASYLQARHHHGKWLVRIEDIDPPREVDGAAKDILTTLECYQFEWDQKPLYQSSQLQYYRKALAELAKRDLIYACSCSRKDLQNNIQKSPLGTLYPGTCADKRLDINSTDHNLRIRIANSNIYFKDKHFGEQKLNLSKVTGDFIIHRKFDLPSYALAVTLDDAYQEITEVVRGEDLLAFTPMQIYLCKKLHLPIPKFLHIPIVVNQQGHKLSKQTNAEAIPKRDCGKVLTQVLNDLGQNTPKHLRNEALSMIWSWAIENWDVKNIPNTKQISYFG